MKRRRSSARIWPALIRRLAHRRYIDILWAPPSLSEVFCPDGLTLVRIDGRAAGADRVRADEAMALAGEPSGLADGRLARGDELFGWLMDGRIVSFLWVSYVNRSVGPVRLADARGRVFPYNAFTLPEHRGRGLFTTLLLAIRTALAREGATAFVADIDVRNASSRRGAEKAGFVAIGQVSFVMVLNRWGWMVDRTVSSSHANPLFHQSASRACLRRQPADA